LASKIKVAATIIVIVVAAVVGGALYLTQTAPKPEKVVTIVYGSDPGTLDTLQSHSATWTSLFNSVQESLLKIDSEGNIIPSKSLATSYEVSPDGLTYTFKLRKGVKFHDGTLFNASAVVWSFMQRYINKDVPFPEGTGFANRFDPIKSVEAVDDYTVKFYLKYPYGPLLANLASYRIGIFSPSTYIRAGGPNADVPLIGTGPFKFVEWKLNERVVLERNENYWGEKPGATRVVINIVPEATTRISMLLAGDADVVLAPPPVEIPNLRQNPNFVVADVPSTRGVIVIMNNQWGPFKDARVRQAVNYAIDKEALVKNVLQGLADTSDSWVTPNVFGYTSLGKWPYDPAKAKQLLAEAGYPNGFKATFATPSGRYLFDLQVSQAIQAYLRDVGIDVELLVQDWPTFVKHLTAPINETKMQMALTGYGIMVMDADGVLTSYFGGPWVPQGNSLVYYGNEEVKAMIKQAREEPDPKVRLQLYDKIMRILWEEQPQALLYFQKNVVVYSKNIKGIVPSNIADTYDITQLDRVGS